MSLTSTKTPAKAKIRTGWRVDIADSPWLNAKLISGLILVIAIAASSFLGGYVWDLSLARVGSAEANLPPFAIKGDPANGFPDGSWDHPLGTENNGRDMLAVLLWGGSRSLRIGIIAATIGLIIGVIMGCISGFLGGVVDRILLVISDAWITIPSLVVLIVIASYVRQMDADTMAALIALFSWPGPTRVIRAQVLTLRERGYIRMARLSGASTLDLIFREMMPNMMPYLAASFTGSVSGGILASTGLEALGLGPTRIPTLGMTIFQAQQATAVFTGQWWWWGFPLIVLAIIFTSLFNIASGLDEVANPRLRGLK